ncbi:MAG: hypothetical protein A2998_00975 [Candidatus Staskawiczbacteria bacterium RIFCSPLOWO2_01_FULL_37_25b]|uniref:DUF4145 domain-containing protein n=2 Tax=Parcubacteria group TaxID=1794811 RepID=A0A1F8F7M5_9BACT|nr:MAG: hypothetical protein A3C61_02350 [Candidatus Yanofskybacteria bacterium RIFCSPHIGHO2_02_FULL_39_10]OGZ73025.1 MAG: hypothetical protein A2998_00975 [Candidatus Staskawiczbacteria bacterium RIFCSPLOWO2_01_FULL_37_25b]
MLDIDFTELVRRLKFTSILLSFLFGFAFVYFMVKFRGLVKIKMQINKLLNPPESAKGGALNSKWEEIVRHSESTREAEWKLAIIEADTLVDDILKSANYPGDTMGERLTNIERGQLLSLDGLWEAHKIRNKLAHDVDYFLRYAEARRAITLYEAALKELDALG